MPINILKLENIFVSYGPVKAINNVSLDVNEGEIVALIGNNGSGKTTLLESVLGINKIDSGKVLFMKRNITNMPTDKIVSLGMCLVPEGHGIISQMKVLENLHLGFYYNYKVDFNRHLESVYRYFPILKERSKQIAKNMSGGEQQMLSIGRGIMAKPKLIMFDEPSMGLAPLLVTKLFNTITSLNKEGYTILLAEQNTRKTLQVAHRCYLFEKGSIVINGRTQELINHPLVLQTYFGG